MKARNAARRKHDRGVPRKGRYDAAQQRRDALVVQFLLILPGFLPPSAGSLQRVGKHRSEELIRIWVMLQVANHFKGRVRNPMRRGDCWRFQSRKRIEAMPIFEKVVQFNCVKRWKLDNKEIGDTKQHYPPAHMHTSVAAL